MLRATFLISSARRAYSKSKQTRDLPFAWVPPPTPQTPDRTLTTIILTQSNCRRAKFDRRGVHKLVQLPCGRFKCDPVRNIQPVDQDELKNTKFKRFETYRKAFPTFTANVEEILLHFSPWEPFSPAGFCDVGFELRLELGLRLLLHRGRFDCFFWEPVVRYLTDDGNGEPIALLDGISIWPTYCCAFLHHPSCLLHRRHYAHLNGNRGIARDMELFHIRYFKEAVHKWL